MIEQKHWAGLWICPDYQHPINAAPPFEFKCTGMELTAEGRKEFVKAAMEIICERN